MEAVQQDGRARKKKEKTRKLLSQELAETRKKCCGTLSSIYVCCPWFWNS